MRISDWSSDVCSSDLRRKVVGIMIHVIALPGLARSPMPAAIVRDDPKAFVCEEERRSFPAVRAKRPTMAERYDRAILRTPVLVVKLDAVLGGDHIHA